MTTLLGGHISELAWERGKLPACFGELELSVADLGFAAQATYWSAFDLLGGMDRNRRRPGADRFDSEGRFARCGCCR